MFKLYFKHCYQTIYLHYIEFHYSADWHILVVIMMYSSWYDLISVLYVCLVLNILSKSLVC